MNQFTIGKPGPKVRRHCSCKVSRKMTKRGPQYTVTCTGTKMQRLLNEADYQKAAAAGEICAYLLDSFGKKG
jgi:hypothetical protein